MSIKITLNNVQTWVNHTSIDIKRGKATVPIAENNGGKSVPLKALTVALLGNYKGRKTNSYITRFGTPAANLNVRFEDGREWDVVFLKDTQVHRILVNDNWETYECDGAPPNVISYLGWYVNKDIQYCANIIDPERMILGVSTTPRQQFLAFRPLLKPDHLEARREQVEQLVKLTTQDITLHRKLLQDQQLRFSNMYEIDEQEISTSLTNTRTAIQELEQIILVSDYTSKYNEFKLNKVYDEATLDTLLTILDTLELQIKVNAHKPKDEHSLNQLLLVLDTLELHTKAKVHKPKDEHSLNQLLLVLDTLQANDKLQQHKVHDTEHIELLLTILDTIQLQTAITAHNKNIRIKLTEAKQLQAQVESILAHMTKEKEKYICPQCGYDMEERIKHEH